MRPIASLDIRPLSINAMPHPPRVQHRCPIFEGQSVRWFYLLCCKNCLCRTNPLRVSDPHKPSWPLASSQRTNPFRMKGKELNKMTTKRTRRLEARVTSEEYSKAAELAETCGLSLSDYIRQCALGQHPRRRLTDKEAEALCSLSDARGDLIRIAVAVKAIQSSMRAQYFSDTRFVERWMRAAVPLIARWKEIQDYITQ